MGKSSINGPFSMAMLNNQRIYIYIFCFSPNRPRMAAEGRITNKLPMNYHYLWLSSK